MSQNRPEIFRGRISTSSGITDIRECYGLSNVARFIDGGLFLGAPNLDGVTDTTPALCLISKLCLAPDIEFYLAAVIKKEISGLKNRLKEMILQAEKDKASGEADSFYSLRNNNCPIYLATDGKAYTRNKKPGGEENLNEILPQLGSGVALDQIYYAIHKPTLAIRSHPSVQGIIDQLGQMVGRERLVEIRPWESVPEITAAMQRMPRTIQVADIINGITTLGGHYKEDLIKRYHSGLNYLANKHFVILSGISGTGKTSLARRYAYSVHGLKNLTDRDPLFFLSAVRPDWTDPVGLLGYYDVFTNRYNVPTFLEAVFAANAYPESPIFFCLDEMNIAKVEYYFADVLSSMETGLPLKLHSSEIALPGDSGILVPSTVYWPRNLFITGTINIDETTNSLSDKVLDRAVIIDLSEMETKKLYDSLAVESESLALSTKECSEIIERVRTILEENQLAFGYRTIEEVIRYHSFALQNGSDSKMSLDQQLVQKVLAKLRGTETQRPMLSSLSETLKAYPLSSRLLERLTSELNELGSFQASR